MQIDSKATVQAFLDASVRGDESAMRALLHADIEVVEADSLPYGGVHRGKDGFIALIRRVFTTWQDTQVSVQSVVTEGDQVVMLATMTGRGRETGTAFTMPIAEVWTLRDGKILRITPYYLDTQLLCDIAAGRR
jgi:ketosteroid isomerase-like protein